MTEEGRGTELVRDGTGYDEGKEVEKKRRKTEEGGLCRKDCD